MPGPRAQPRGGALDPELTLGRDAPRDFAQAPIDGERFPELSPTATVIVLAECKLQKRHTSVIVAKRIGRISRGAHQSEGGLMRRMLAGALVALALAAPSLAAATTVYPIDRAQILAGSLFDFKVELDGVVNPSDVKVTVNGDDPARLLAQAPQFVDRQSAADP